MHDDPRTRILAAAGPIFARKGYQAATVREICQAAGVNVASINYYFGEKENLYIETVRQARQVRQAQVPMPALSRDMPARERLQMFTRTLLTRMIGVRETTWQSQLMMREILQPSRACVRMVEEYIRPEFNLLLDILDDLLPEQTPLHVRQQIGFSLVGQCLFYRVARGVVSMLVEPDDERDSFSVDRLADHINQVVLASLGKAPPIVPAQRASRIREAI
jgi:AcrR family transcriptional regulator